MSDTATQTSNVASTNGHVVAATSVRPAKTPWVSRFAEAVEGGYDAMRYGHVEGAVIGKSAVGATVGATAGAVHQAGRATTWAAKTAAKGGLIGVAALGGAAYLARNEMER